jgi:hypothetical protein
MGTPERSSSAVGDEATFDTWPHHMPKGRASKLIRPSARAFGQPPALPEYSYACDPAKLRPWRSYGMSTTAELR